MPVTKAVIGCKKCEKNCPVQAITVTDNVAHIDYDKCTNCGLAKRIVRDIVSSDTRFQSEKLFVLARESFLPWNPPNMRSSDLRSKSADFEWLEDCGSSNAAEQSVNYNLKGRPPCGMIERRLRELLFGAVPEKRSLL